MKICSKIIFKYNNLSSAEIIKDSLDVDNEDFLTSELSDTSLIFEISCDSLGSFLNTADDLISCEIVGENIIKSEK